jgi:NH3-dependent NAD+ synthetase
MSGGIDSAVAALMLKDQGHNVVGVFMKNWDPADECGSETCDLDADQKDMQEVCKFLNIPAYEVRSTALSTMLLYFIISLLHLSGEFRAGVLERSVFSFPGGLSGGS